MFFFFFSVCLIAGSFGSVFRVKNKNTGQLVALKIIYNPTLKMCRDAKKEQTLLSVLGDRSQYTIGSSKFISGEKLFVAIEMDLLDDAVKFSVSSK